MSHASSCLHGAFFFTYLYVIYQAGTWSICCAPRQICSATILGEKVLVVFFFFPPFFFFFFSPGQLELFDQSLL